MRQPFDLQGVIYDQPPWELGDTWSDARNVRFRDGAAEDFGGQTNVFGTPLGSAYRVLPISTGTEYFWVYPGINNVWATDGNAHIDITSGTYSASENLSWNGGAFQSHLILNTGREPPASWSPNLSNRITSLANWETGLLAEVVRPFRNFLFALRCSEGGSYNPRLLRHSNGATAGSLPTSWDYTDPNTDTGRVDFGQTTDSLIDCLPLRDILVIYKQRHTWAAQYVGGNDNPFIYRQVFAQVGALSQYCIAAFEGRHLVLSTDDVVMHDLNQPVSVVDKRMRKWLFTQINPDRYRQCFVSPNYRDREIWICFPEAGHDYPNLAVVWNWSENTLQVRELGFDCPHINYGVVSPSTSTTIDQATGTFDTATGTFDEQTFNPSITSMLMANPGATRLVKVDNSGSFNGETFTKRVHREALPLGDFQRYKRVKRVLPRVIGAVGDTFQIYIGTRTTFEDDVTWSSPETYTIGTDAFANFLVTGRIIDIRFEYSGTQSWRLHGFDVEWEPDGYY